MANVGGSLLASVQSLLAARRTDGRRFWPPPPGLPEGLSVSPVLANLVLDEMDKRLELRDVRFLRYADDYLILARDEDEAHRRGEQLAGFLAEIGLAFGTDKTGPVSFDAGFRFVGADFLGEEVLHDGAPVARSANGALDPLGKDSAPPALQSLGAPWLDALSAARSAAEVREAKTEDEEDEAELGDAVFLRTLYVEGQDRSVGKEGKRFIIKEATKRIGAVHAEKIGQMILFPGAYATTPALRLAIEEDIPVTFIGYGTFGRLESTNRDRVARQRLQFLRAEDPAFAFSFASACVAAKIENCRRLLRRRAGGKKLDALDRLVDQVDRLRLDPEDPEKKLERLRGLEGAASAAYFNEWPALLAETRFEWRGRRRRPPPDPINAMLSFGYTLLFYNIYSIVRLHGLHPYVGHLHLMKEGHPALISDLIEEWRAPIVESVVLSLVRKRVLGPEDFAIPEAEGTACLLGDAARRRFIEAFERRMRVVVTHPVTGWRVAYRRAIEVQVRAFIHYLDARAETYEPFVWET